MSLFRRFLHRRKAHPIGLCERCSRICWKSLFAPTYSLSSDFPIYEVPPEELKAVACRLCQFVGNTLITLGFSEELSQSALPYQLDIDGELPPRTSGVANLEISQQAQYITPSFAKVFVVTENQNIRATTQHESLMVGGIPLRFVRQSIANCQQFHKGECLPNDVKSLSSLTVYDCETRKVICAPPNCEYVALSYVWGPHKNGTNVVTDHAPESVPRTVKDSVRVTLGLGYRYLWVDRYCIDQTNHGEKMEQISQMADIYACAQLTIIAAAGEDANYGLPNLMQISEAPRCLSLDHVTLSHYPRRSAKSTLSKTTWGSRAWTFQECYFSKRRLVVLNDRAVYICNKRAAKDMPQGWYTYYQDNEYPGRDVHEMRRSMQMIEAYCGREMTYESDSLLAIMSALSTCDESAVRHIWGLPYSSKEHGSDRIEANHPLQTALLWKHAQPCSRRGALPSWSPMAWTGKISWGGQSFPYSWDIQTIANGTGALQTSGVGSNMTEDLEDQPRRLQITARILRFRPVRVFQLKEETIQTSSQPDDPQDFCLAIPLSKEIDLISHTPCWDVDPSGIDIEKPILGLFFEDNGALEVFRRSSILLVQWSGNYYERIGILPLTYPSRNVFCYFTHQAKYIRWLDKATGTFGHLEICDRDRHRYQDHPVYHIYNRAEWKGSFEEKTIVLG